MASRTTKKKQAKAEDEFAMIEDFVSESVPEDLKEKGKKLMKMYAEYQPKLIWAPNWSGSSNGTSAPSGFSFSVAANSTPPIPELFSETKMYYGTVALPLDDGICMSDGTKLTEEYIIKNMRDIGRRMNLNISQKSALPVNLSKNFNGEVEVSEWKESLGGSGSYAGLFLSTERIGYKNKNRFWLVVQSGNVEASEEIYRLMEQATSEIDFSSSQPSPVTWESFFMGNSNTTYLKGCITRSRQRLLASLAQSLNLKVDSSIDPHSRNGKSRVISPEVETISYSVGTDIETARPVYHSATVDPVTCGNGLILNENPFIGPIILKGPNDYGKDFGGIWKTSKGSCGAFPSCTGRKASMAELNKKALKGKVNSSDISRFVWQDQDSNPSNSRLADGVYRLRDDAFKGAEKKLGYKHEWDSVTLKPLLVKVASDTVDY